MSDRGALVLAYRPPDRRGRDDAEPWEFACGRCGVEFVVPEDELVFRSVPKDRLLAKVG